ncbi:hypothetical protein BDP27DRAFT_1310186 [Rhodocollybia butyracea]|uniref:Uncharacterized protein n=1 Tax=Rhodocollybia butyracea TaxID=206335 RepID=A0A9P5QCF1_9AGAR|nr:hypothetical protein BDP27DRAFT_1310186 [Rhodocollybia butyracea]
MIVMLLLVYLSVMYVFSLPVFPLLMILSAVLHAYPSGIPVLDIPTFSIRHTPFQSTCTFCSHEMDTSFHRVIAHDDTPTTFPRLSSSSCIGLFFHCSSSHNNRFAIECINIFSSGSFYFRFLFLVSRLL